MSQPISFLTEEKPEALRGVKFYLETFGCQMNDYDSDGLSELLKRELLVQVDAPELAQVILVNSCSVREAVEEKILGRLSDLGRHKLNGTAALLGVVGCMGQRLGEEIQRRVPMVDLVMGTEAYPRMPDYLRRGLEGGIRKVDRERSDSAVHPVPPAFKESFRAFVTIMRGCDNHCTFCIVPNTRGAEVSRPAGSILREVELLAAGGTFDITLLGQNVNSYRWGSMNFAGLMRAVGDLPGVKRVRFTTSNPQDMTDDVLLAVSEHPNIVEHIHLPVQAGNNRVLEAMHRFYTREKYFALVDRARDLIPHLALTTDLIVGFPGETDEEFEETLDLVRRVQYDTAFAFKFSPRSGTPAAMMPGQVPEAVKTERLKRLLEIQKQMTDRRSLAMVGRRVELAVEKLHPKLPGQALTRTRTNRTVTVPATEGELGSMVWGVITEARGQALYGERASS